MLDLLSEFAAHLYAGFDFQEFVRERPELSSVELVSLIAQDQRFRTKGKAIPRIEEYLSSLPQLPQDGEAMMEAVVAEHLLLEENGITCTEQEYIDRFPYLEASIQRQFQLHRALSSRVPERARDSVRCAGSNTPTEQASFFGAFSESGRGDNTEQKPVTDFSFLFDDPALANFEMMSILGCGAMSVVFKAFDRQLRRAVAVKVLAADVSADSTQAKHLEREARVVAGLEHTSIVKVFEVRTDRRGLPLLIMEYIGGGTLAERMNQGPLTVEETLRIMIDVTAGLTVAHASNLIHRDLKPANILMTTDSRPKIADFGLAKLHPNLESSLSGANSIVGTPRYMSPEQARSENESLTPATDVYSLGAICYEILSGQPPFQAATPWEVVSDILNQDLTPLRQINRRIPRDLESITHLCLHKNARRRYANAGELNAELQRYLDGMPIAARPISLYSRFTKWCRRNRGIAAMTVSLFGLALATATISTLSALRLSTANQEITKGQQALLVANRRAETDRNAAVQSLNTMITKLYDELSKDPGSAKSKRAVVVSSLEGLRKVSRVGDNYELNRSTIVAQQRMGDMLLLVGESPLAQQEYETALLLAQQQADTQSRDALSEHQRISADIELAVQNEIASAIDSLTRFWIRLGDPDRAEQYADRFQQLNTRLIEKWPNDGGLRRNMIKSAVRTIDIRWLRGEFELALSESLKWEGLAEKLAKENPDSQSNQLDVAQFYQRLARAHLQAGDARGGLTPLHKSLLAIEKAQTIDPSDKSLRVETASLKRLHARLLSPLEQYNAALDAINGSVQTSRELVAQDPANLQRKFDLAAGLTTRQTVYELLEDVTAMERDLKESADIYIESLQIDPKLTHERALAMHSYFMLAFNAFDRFEFTKCNDFVDQVNALDRVHDELSLTRGTDAQMAVGISSILREMSLRVLGTWNEDASDVASASLLGWISLRDARDGIQNKHADDTRQLLSNAGFPMLTTIDETLAQANSFAIQHPMMKLNLARLNVAVRIRQAEFAFKFDSFNAEAKANALKIALQEYQTALKVSPIMRGYLAADKDCKWLYETSAFKALP